MRRLVAACAWLHLLGLVAAFTLLAIGERWWVSGIFLYMPRLPMLAPLLALVPALVWARAFRLLAASAAGGAAWLLFGMGLVLPGTPAASGPQLRLATFNVWYGGQHGSGPLLAELDRVKPDVIVLQAMRSQLAPAVRSHFAEPDWHVHSEGDFLVASRYPIRAVYEPPLGADGRRGPYMRYLLDTPLGPLALFNVHPMSPSPALEALRGDGLVDTLRGLVKLHLPAGAADKARDNIADRATQVDEIVAAIATTRKEHPESAIVVAGDTNLPAASALLGRFLATPMRDAFSLCGSGLGYTFPANRWPRSGWMRIDRVLIGSAGSGAGGDLTAVDVGVGDPGASDHRLFLAVLSHSKQ